MTVMSSGKEFFVREPGFKSQPYLCFVWPITVTHKYGNRTADSCWGVTAETEKEIKHVFVNITFQSKSVNWCCVCQSSMTRWTYCQIKQSLFIINWLSDVSK